MNPVEKLVDIRYEISSKIKSIQTGRSTAVRKVVIEGPMVNGQIRPDLKTRADIWREAARVGGTYTSDFHARQVRRKIVFLDSLPEDNTHPLLEIIEEPQVEQVWTATGFNITIKS